MPAAKPTPGNLHEVLNLGFLMGSSWDGFLLLPGDASNHYQGRFQHAYWRKPFEIGDLCAMFYTTQQVKSFQHDLERLRQEIEAVSLRADRAENEAAYYRRQLWEASRLGLMFSLPDR